MSKRFVRRKWGWYITLLDRRHFKVKLLRFNMKANLSQQYHKLRNELWLFLKGEGFFTETLRRVKSGDFYFIAPKQSHEFNPFIKTWVLEIQYGEKCVEEDIVRV